MALAGKESANQKVLLVCSNSVHMPLNHVTNLKTSSLDRGKKLAVRVAATVERKPEPEIP